MKKSFNVALFLLTAAITVVFSGAVVSAQQSSLDDAQIARITANCTSMRATVNQLHASDALLRVNRGQIYESMASNLMERFNDRLGSNRLDNKATVSVTTDYRSALTNFRTNYIRYEQKMTQALRIDCATQPALFYTTVQEARELRLVVHEDVKKLHQLMDDYKSSVSGFMNNYERVTN